MIYSHIVGGLGNQMFQYAAGLRLERERGTQLRLDIQDYVNYDDREYVLDFFKIKAEIAIPAEVAIYRKYQDFPYRRIPQPLLRLVPPFRGKTYYHQKVFHYDPIFETLPDNTYIKGHFVSYKYFEQVEKEIFDNFQLKNGYSKAAQKLQKEVKKDTCISLHIRRGDYVKVPKFKARHGVLSLEYYQNALTLIESKIGKKFTIYAFSDDIDWVKKNLKTKHKIVSVSDKISLPHEDLLLMSECDHNIIANSTFSWWGAYLNQNENKIVCYPSNWDNVPNRDYSDLAPKEWQKV